MEEAGDGDNRFVAYTGTKDRGDAEEDPLEKAFCLVSVDNLFDIAVLVFEALVGVLQLIDANNIFQSLYGDVYCNGTNLALIAFDFEETQRLCDQERYTLDTFVTIWEQFDLIVAFNFTYFSVGCLFGIGIIGLYVYLRSIYNFLCLMLYYWLGILYSIGMVLWILVGVAVFPLYLLFACANGISAQVEAWCDRFSPGFLLKGIGKLLFVPRLNCAEFTQIMLYPYSERSTDIVAKLGIEHVLERVLSDEDDEDQRNGRDNEDWCLKDSFEWAQAAGEKLLVNIMKFGNLIYQVSDIARDIVYLAFLSNYSTDTLLGLDLGTTTIVDIVMSSLLILKLFRDLEINIGTTPERARDILVNAETGAGEDQYPELGHEAYAKERDEFIHTTWCQAILGLVLLLLVNILVCMLILQIIIWMIPVLLVGFLIGGMCIGCMEMCGCECDC